MQGSPERDQNDPPHQRAAELVGRARALRSSDEATVLYRSWAETYDHDVFDTLGVTGSARIADLLAEHHRDRQSPVLDLGCGTGAVGSHLRTHSFPSIDGWDISPEMIAVAERRGSYRRFRVVDLTEPISASPDAHRYAACISAGTFTSGHVDASAVGRIGVALADHVTVAWVIAQAMADSFRHALAGLNFTVVFEALEPIRTGGPIESVMLVARR